MHIDDLEGEKSCQNQNVEKEKGIICQELALYMQNPDTRLLNETYKCLYKNHALRYDIGGDEASVNRINKEELENRYDKNSNF